MYHPNQKAAWESIRVMPGNQAYRTVIFCKLKQRIIAVYIDVDEM